MPAPVDSSLKASQVVRGEMSAKTTYQKSAKGPVAISECAADGKFVLMENTGRKVSEEMADMTCRSNIDEATSYRSS